MSPTIAQAIADHEGAPLARREADWLEVTLNRPAQHNRIDPADIDALLALLEPLRADPGTTRGLLITGAGERSFSSGYTLQAIETRLDDRLEQLFDTLETLPFVTIAALNGSITGGATDLALCCDIRIGVPGIRMYVPAARLGIHYYSGGLRRYVTRLGLSATSRLMLAGVNIDTEEMLRIGFLSEIIPRSALDKRIAELRATIAQTEPGAVADMKRHLLALAAGGSSDERVALERSMSAAHQASLRTPALQERLAALLGRPSAKRGEASAEPGPDPQEATRRNR
ncbi:MAG: enoyl-CoA hydratase/isomerase family protein [Burkholderiaceae bacterium]|nr:enoyl-CoA hydratase/isomerase family protein [Burkholderiaceae bacterium]